MNDGHFAGRQQIASDRPDTGLGSDDFGRLPTVPGEHHRLRHPEHGEPLHQRRHLVPQAIREFDGAHEPAVHGDVGRGAVVPYRRNGDPPLGQEPIRPDRDLVPFDARRHSGPRCLGEIGRRGERPDPVAARCGDRRAQVMR